MYLLYQSSIGVQQLFNISGGVSLPAAVTRISHLISAASHQPACHSPSPPPPQSCHYYSTVEIAELNEEFMFGATCVTDAALTCFIENSSRCRSSRRRPKVTDFITVISPQTPLLGRSTNTESITLMFGMSKHPNTPIHNTDLRFQQLVSATALSGEP